MTFNDAFSKQPLYVDRNTPVGVKDDGSGRGALETFIKNSEADPVLVNVIAGIISGTITPQGLTKGGRISIVDLVDTEWRALPTTPLLDRNNITIQAKTDNGEIMLYNYINTIGVTEGFELAPGGTKSVSIKDNIHIYGRMVSGTGKAIVDEIA